MTRASRTRCATLRLHARTTPPISPCPLARCASGHSFTSNHRDYFRHDSLPWDAQIWRILDESASEALMWLRDLRIKADYFEDFVVLEETSEALEVARGILEAALEEVN